MMFATSLHRISTITPQDRNTAVDRLLVERRQDFYRFFRRSLARPEDAEDAFQDFCLKAIRAANTLEDDAKVNAWLDRILRNTLTDHYRRRATRQNAETAFTHELRCEAAPNPAPEPVACSYIHDLLPLLKPDYAEIIRRVDLEEIPRQRIAAELGLTTNNLRLRLHRARRALRIEIEHRCQGFRDGAIRNWGDGWR